MFCNGFVQFMGIQHRPQIQIVLVQCPRNIPDHVSRIDCHSRITEKVVHDTADDIGVYLCHINHSLQVGVSAVGSFGSAVPDN